MPCECVRVIHSSIEVDYLLAVLRDTVDSCGQHSEDVSFVNSVRPGSGLLASSAA
jgi:hypothetical protein